VVKKNIVNSFTKRQLDAYSRDFDLGKPDGTLEAAEKRYIWLRKFLREYDDTYSRIFPKNWDVPAIISREFCVITNSQLSKIISSANGKYDINALIKALQKTIEMERELNIRFRQTTLDNISAYYPEDDDETRSASVELIKLK